ncbi:hypothetical protein M8C21_015991 [Ambrosia artemisiifolia]|uniref:Uncharacterized protein n=1 Tax=Ambrosia artemisiifolia TaxID=4212 RepID=A0AAD5D303_AMBAR|nr:hypothetical protein M8C21_015991 [Ambrosia artemisiifolia]
MGWRRIRHILCFGSVVCGHLQYAIDTVLYMCLSMSDKPHILLSKKLRFCCAGIFDEVAPRFKRRRFDIGDAGDDDAALSSNASFSVRSDVGANNLASSSNASMADHSTSRRKTSYRASILRRRGSFAGA